MHLAVFFKWTLHLTWCIFRAFWRDWRCLSSSTHFSVFPSLCAKASPLFCSLLSTGILNAIGFKISPLATDLSVGLQVPFCNHKQKFYRKIGEKKRNHLTFWCFKALHPPFTHRKESFSFDSWCWSQSCRAAPTHVPSPVWVGDSVLPFHRPFCTSVGA